VPGKVLDAGSFRDHEYNLWPKIRYTYVVDGKEYLGSRIYASGRGSFYGHYRWIDELLEKYSKGSNITILYDPKNHKVSALERGSWASIAPLFLIGSLFIFVGVKGV